MEPLNTTDITKSGLRQMAANVKADGYRFVTITCLEIDADTLEFIYHFDKDLELKHFRLQTPKTEAMQSISTEFFSAFLVENEIIDQFGTTFRDLVLDFGGTLYLDEDDDISSTPFCKYGVKPAK